MSSENWNPAPMDEELNRRLRQAVRGEPVPPELAVRIRQRLDEERARGGWALWRTWAWAPAAALVVLVSAGVAYQQGHLRWTSGMRESYMDGLLRRVSNPMRPGLDDHLHCSVYGRVPKTVPPLADAVKNLPPQFHDLLTIIQEKAPQPFRLYSAHQCTRHGRKFIHFQLTSDGRLLSVIVTRRDVAESFVRDQIVPALAGDGAPVYQSQAQHFQLAAFETRDFLAYVISDLDSAANRQLMLAMASQLRAVLRKLEG